MEWLEIENEYEIRGASLLIVLDDIKQVCRIKLIDLGSFEKIESRDEGFIIGIKNLLNVIKKEMLHCSSGSNDTTQDIIWFKLIYKVC